MNWKDNLAKKWWQVKIADQAVQVEKDTRRQAIVEHAIRRAYDQNTTFPEEQMAVSVGDSVHYHTEKNKSISPLLSGLLGALTVGAGIAGYNALVPTPKPEPSATQAQTQAQTQNAKYQFSLGFPDKKEVK